MKPEPTPPPNLGAKDRRRALCRGLAAFFGVVGFFALALGRVPDRLFTPFLFMEQATVYYKHAFEHHWLKALLAPHQGYYNFWTNAVTVGAAALPMEYAPYTVMAGGTMVGALLALLVFLPGSPLPTLAARLLALWLMVLIPPAGERFLLSYSHFYVCAAAVIVLLSAPRPGWESWVCRAALALCALTGPLTAFLLPAFALALALDRTPERRAQLAIVGLGALIQGWAFYYAARHGFNVLAHDSPAARFHGGGEIDALVFWLFNRGLVHPFLGGDTMRQTGHVLASLTAEGGWRYYVAIPACTVLALLWLRLLYGPPGQPGGRIEALLAVSFFCVIAGIFYCAVAPGSSKASLIHAAHRYFIPPAMLAGLAMAMHWARCRAAFWKSAYEGLIIALLTSGLYMWHHQAAWEPRPIPWREQVAIWKKDPAYRIKIMPPGYTLRLTPRKHR